MTSCQGNIHGYILRQHSRLHAMQHSWLHARQHLRLHTETTFTSSCQGNIDDFTTPCMPIVITTCDPTYDPTFEPWVKTVRCHLLRIRSYLEFTLFRSGVDQGSLRVFCQLPRIMHFWLLPIPVHPASVFPHPLEHSDVPWIASKIVTSELIDSTQVKKDIIVCRIMYMKRCY